MAEQQPPPGSVSDALGAAGDCPTVRWRNADWKVAWPTARTIGRLELLVAAAATAEAKELEAAGVDPGATDGLRTRLLGRAHKAGGELWDQYLRGPDGGVLILLSLLREHHPKASESDARGMAVEAKADVDTAMALVDPRFPAAVEAAKGLPAGSTAARPNPAPTGP